MSTQGFDPNRAQNLPEIEKQMAVKCVEQAQTLWSLYEKVKPSTLRLTKLDDEIYQDMEETFEELRQTDQDKSGGVAKIDEERMKSDEGKKKWRDFIAKYENKGKYSRLAWKRFVKLTNCHSRLLLFQCPIITLVL